MISSRNEPAYGASRTWGVPLDPSNDCQQQERRRDDKVKALGYSQLKFRESRSGETGVDRV
jgi:hypothetical protein